MTHPLEETLFDVVIVGSGFGGGVMAYALSHAGLRTLLVERGDWARRDDDDWSGRAVMLEGRYHGDVPTLVQQGESDVVTSTLSNEVVGGGSVFFGGAALRMRATDFAEWPIGYDVLEPHYDAAERLLEVHGHMGDDPCEPARARDYPFSSPALTAPALRIYRAAQAIGFRPFRLPMALNHSGPRAPKCVQCGTCDGFPCKISAKNDVTTTALASADNRFLTIAPGLLAARLRESQGRIQSLEVIERRSAARLTLRGRLFVVSCGAIGSPALLLRSGLDRYDQSGLLGRRLMRHCNGMVGYVFPFRTNPTGLNHKQVCISDLYESRRALDGRAVGVLQDLCLPPLEVVRSKVWPALAWAAGLGAAHLQTLICIAEDEPCHDNRVTLDAHTDRNGLPLTSVRHRYTEADHARRDLLLDAAGRVLRRAGGLAGKVSLIDSFSHAVGSVHFGSAPRRAPLDVDCRMHGVHNLFVVDGSFMPTSAGVNPSLTISANALRVAARIREDFSALRL